MIKSNPQCDYIWRWGLWVEPLKDPESGALKTGIVVVQSLSHVQLFATPGLQHSRLPCPSLSLRVCSNSGPLGQRCHQTISFYVTLFSSCPQSFPASGSLPVSQPVRLDGQSIRASASASVLLMNIQGWFPLGWTGLISLRSKGLSRASPTQFKSVSSLVLSLLCDPTLTCVHNYWKNHR